MTRAGIEVIVKDNIVVMGGEVKHHNNYDSRHENQVFQPSGFDIQGDQL